MAKTVSDLYSAAKNTASPGAGLCASWISRVFAKIGITCYGNACCMYHNYCNQSLSNLTEGMIVAVNQTKSSHGGPRGCGHLGYGHVGIYLGGQVWSSVTASTGGGRIEVESLQSFKNRAYTGCTVKCGWAAGVKLSGTSGTTSTTGTTGKYTSALSCSELPVLYHGKSGTTVKVLQALLCLHGFNVSIDGHFGDGTKSGVGAFQKANGLNVDNCCGPETWAKLFGVNTTLDVMTAGFNIKAEVKALQQILNKLYGCSLSVDGDYSSSTSYCVKLFQSKHGLSADNFVGGATWKKLLGIS